MINARASHPKNGFAQTAFDAVKNVFSRRGRSKFTNTAYAQPVVPNVVEVPSTMNKVVELGTNIAMAVAAGGTLYQAANYGSETSDQVSIKLSLKFILQNIF